MTEQPEDDAVATDGDQTRRRYLAALGTAGALALAGCGGDSGNGAPTATETARGDTGGADGSDPATTTTSSVSDEELPFGGGTTASGGACPSPPFSYSQFGAAYPMTDDPLVTFEAPEGEGFTVGTANRQWSLRYGPRRNRMDVRAERRSGTVEEAADPGAGSNADLTDQYDVPAGARVITRSNPGDVVDSIRVLLPTPTEGEHVEARIGLTNTENCPEAAETVQDRIVNTVKLA